LDFGGEFFFGRELEAVAGGENGLLVFGEGVFHHGVVFVGDEQQTERGVIGIFENIGWLGGAESFAG